MASEIRAGRAYVEAILRDKLSPQLAKIEQRLKATGEKVSAMGSAMTLAGVAIVGAFAPAIKAASDLNEAMSKFDVVFGNRSKAVKQWADTTAKEVGRSAKVVADFASYSQDLFVPLGLDPTLAEEMSKSLVKLAIDLGSFKNASDDDAFQKLMSGMLGESEPLKAFGIIVNDAATKAELLNQKLDPNKATDAQKAMARYNIIMRATKSAQGDAVRTADSFANQLKRLEGEAYDAAAALGSAVLPLATKFIGKVNEAVVKVSEWVDKNKESAKQWGEFALKVGAGAIAVGGALFVLGKLIAVGGAAVATIKALSLAMAFFAANPVVAVGAGLAALVVGLAGYSAVMGRIPNLTEKANDAAYQQSKSLKDSASTVKDQLVQLKELASKTSLTSDEQKTAATLVGELSKRYGNLGIVVNTATGAILNYDTVLKKATETERRTQIEKVGKALVETTENIKNYRQELTTLGAAGSDLGMFLGVSFAIVGGNAKIDEVGQKLTAEQEKMLALQKQLIQLRAGGDPFGGKQGNNAAQQAALQAARIATLKGEYEELTKQMAKLREEQRRELLNDTDQKIVKINDELKEQIDLSDKLVKNAQNRKDNNELARLQKERVDIIRNAEQQIAKVREDALAKQIEADRKHADQIRSDASDRATLLGELADQASKSNPPAAAALDKQRAALLADAAKREADIRAKADKDEADAVRARLMTELGEIQKARTKALQSNDADAFNKAEQRRVDAVRTAEAEIARIREASAYRQADQAKKQADEERNRQRERQDAQREAAQKQLDQRTFLLEQLKELAGKRGDTALAKEYDRIIKDAAFEEQLKGTFGNDEKAKAIARQLQSSINGAAGVDNRYSSAGLFNAAGVQSLQGSQYQDRSLKAQEDTAKNTKKIKEDMAKNGVKFG